MLNGLIRVVRRFLAPHPDPTIGDLIKPPRVLYPTHDDALRIRTEHKRRLADTFRRAAIAHEVRPIAAECPIVPTRADEA